MQLSDYISGAALISSIGTFFWLQWRTKGIERRQLIGEVHVAANTVVARTMDAFRDANRYIYAVQAAQFRIGREPKIPNELNEDLARDRTGIQDMQVVARGILDEGLDEFSITELDSALHTFRANTVHLERIVQKYRDAIDDYNRT